MKFNTAMICDILLIILFLLVIIRYMTRGFLAGIVSLFGNIASMAGALFVSRTFAQPIFDKLLRPGLEKSVMENITENGMDIAELAEHYGGFLPDSFIQQVVNAVNEAVNESAAVAAQKVAELVLEPIFVPLISIVLFFVVFTVMRFIVSLLIGLLTHANGIPLAGTVNRGMGALLGAAAGLIDLFLIYCAAWSLMLLTGGVLPVLNSELFENSFIFQLLGNLNPFVV